jgi:hypothetical protein
MSKYNKVNKSNYTQAGRLPPDEMARERAKQDPEGHARPAHEPEAVTGGPPNAEQESTRPRNAPEE